MNAGSRDRLDLTDDINRAADAFIDDLIGDLTTVNLDLARKLESDAHPFALHRSDSHDSDRVLRVTDDDLFTLTTSDYEHLRPPNNSLLTTRSIQARHFQSSGIRGEHSRFH